MILFLGIDEVRSNATQQRLYFMAYELKKVGYKVRIVVPLLPSNQAIVDRLELSGDVKWLTATTILGQQYQRHKLLLDLSPDVCISVGSGLRYLVIPARCPVVHDFDELTSAFAGMRSWKKLYYRIIENLAIALSGKVLVASKYLMRRWAWRKKMQIDKVYLPNGHNYESNNVQPSSSVTLAVNPHVDYLYIGSIMRMYQIEDLILFAKHLSSESRSFLVHVAGDGPDRKWFESATKEAMVDRYFQLHGHLNEDELGRLLDKVSICLFPIAPTVQNWARCPIKTYLYLSKGKPTVTCAVGEVYEAFENLAFYYEYGSVESMVEAAKKALNVDQIYQSSEMSKRAAETSWSARVKSVDSVFRSFHTQII